MASLFLLTIPVIIEGTNSSAQLLRQWHSIFYRGHIQGPAISTATGLMHSYAAWSRASQGATWRPFAVAAAVTVTMIPFTWVFMANVNNQLFRAVDLSGKEGEAPWPEAERLVKLWGRWNVVRALFPLSGAVLGLLGATGLVAF